MIKNSIELFIFDLDGTLVDSSHTVLKILNLIRCELDMSPISHEDALSVLSLGGADMIAKTIHERLDVDYYLKYFRLLYMKDNLKNEKLFDHALKFLTYLTSVGKSVALCSNKPKELVDKVLLHHDLLDYFDFVISGSDVKNKKPSAEGINKIIKNAAVDREKVIMIGDSIVDQVAAENAEINFLFFEGGYNDGINFDKIDLKFNNYMNLIGLFK